MSLVRPSGEQAAEPAAVSEEAAPVPRPWLLERLRLDRTDLVAMGVLLLVAFVFRFFSPIMPDFFSRPVDLLSRFVLRPFIWLVVARDDAEEEEQIAALSGLFIDASTPSRRCRS